jgi:hypothetical protein
MHWQLIEPFCFPVARLLVVAARPGLFDQSPLPNYLTYRPAGGLIRPKPLSPAGGYFASQERPNRMTDTTPTPDADADPAPDILVTAAKSAMSLFGDLRIAYSAAESAAEQIVLEELLEAAGKIERRLSRLASCPSRVAHGADSGGQD